MIIKYADGTEYRSNSKDNGNNINFQVSIKNIPNDSEYNKPSFPIQNQKNKYRNINSKTC